MNKRNFEMLIETLAKNSKRLKNAFLILVFGIFYAYSPLHATTVFLEWENWSCMTCFGEEKTGTLRWIMTDDGHKMSILIGSNGEILKSKTGWKILAVPGKPKTGSAWIVDAKVNFDFNTSYLLNHTSVFIVDSITSAGDTVGKGFIGVLNEVEYEYDFSNATQRIDDYRKWLGMCRRLALRRVFQEEVEVNTQKLLSIEVEKIENIRNLLPIEAEVEAEAEEIPRKILLKEESGKIVPNSTISPNPVNDSATLELEIEEAGYYLFLIANANGDVVFYHDEYVNAGMFSKTFSMSNMTKGAYYLNVSISTSNEENRYRAIRTIPFIIE